MTKKGFNQQLHKQILINILIDIFKKLNGKIGFKGGTCAFLFYNLPRISLDLDFDILKPLTKEDLENIKIILERHGNLKDFCEKKFTILFLLDYQVYSPNIKIEFNKRVWENNNYKLIWFLGVPVKIADESTLLTNKIIALTNRRQSVSRDLFDVYYFLKVGFSMNENLVRERTNKTVNDYLKYLISFIQENYTPKNILQGMGEILDQKQKQWAKKELMQETIKEINKLI